MASSQPSAATDASTRPPTAPQTPAESQPRQHPPPAQPQDEIQNASQPSTQLQSPETIQPQPQTQTQSQLLRGDSSTLRQRLTAAESHWQWKFGLRTTVIIAGIIGLGCAAWIFASSPTGPYTSYIDSRDTVFSSLITFSISIVWCTVCILVLLLRKPNAPVHPGVAVGLDLLLWLAFIPSCMFILLGLNDTMRFGNGGIIGKYSSYGYYRQADNGTWVWNATEYDSYYGRSRDCSYSGDYRGYTYGFANCAEEDAYVNALWKDKRHRVGVEMTATVCQFLGLVLHLALFAWACVDTNIRNRRKVTKDAEKLAGEIVMNMVRSGAIVQAPGPVVRGYSVLLDKGYVQPWPQQPQQGQWVQQAQWGKQPMPSMPGPAYQMQPMRSLGPLPQKGESARFA
ncbi:hypothetical protein CC78DRAFT_533880 [Lojkania enalia]|uniref:Uncharacterized protein n=1 Tax=Lojkania enalia TaxID=147567 RepID=A0A9P4K687_9PLEO|nr:hypothetical protein CC78DRAFT_533880 [Didymosphaeria enalia]